MNGGKTKSPETLVASEPKGEGLKEINDQTRAELEELKEKMEAEMVEKRNK